MTKDIWNLQVVVNPTISVALGNISSFTAQRIIRRIEIRSLAFILFTEQFQFLRNNTLVTMTVMWNPVTPPTRCRSYIPWRSQISTFRLYIRRPTSQKVEILKADALTGSHPYHGTVHKICIYTDRRTTGIKTIMLARTGYPFPMSALKAPQSIEENGGLTQQ